MIFSILTIPMFILDKKLYKKIYYINNYKKNYK